MQFPCMVSVIIDQEMAPGEAMPTSGEIALAEGCASFEGIILERRPFHPRELTEGAQEYLGHS